jgi:hypothetical protein
MTLGEDEFNFHSDRGPGGVQPEDPRPGEQYCYRRGRLVFSGLRGLDRAGSLYLLEGDWGVMAIQSAHPSVDLD